MTTRPGGVTTEQQRAPRIEGVVALAWHRLAMTGGAVSVRRLAREVGWSHKHLITRFKQQVGVAPKRAARLVRFDRVLRRLHDGPSPWAELAAELGYADQAHLVREFREFAGTSPSAFPAVTSVNPRHNELAAARPLG
jgi:AraC-like DNA-binding protein